MKQFYGVALLGFACLTASKQIHSDPWIQAILDAEVQREQYLMPGSISFKNETMRCFDHDMGCWTANETKHYGTFPEDPGRNGINTTFHLYSRDNLDNSTIMEYEYENTYNNVQQLKKSDRPLYIVAHGFGGTGRTFWVVWMKNALLEVQDANVIAVDWRRGSSLPLYNQAAANTQSVGRATAKLIAEITKIYGISSKRIHYVGFSMGAQLGGFAGRHFYKLTGTKFGRLTVLDAAAPGFERYGTENHVTKDDAEFTIGVHTSAGDSIVTGKVGMVQPVGHIDFYPNGGIYQAGCRFYEVKCNHERAPKYFEEAVRNSVIPNSCSFTARHCNETREEMSKDVCTVVGDEVGVMSLEPAGSDKMYLKTNPEAPWCYQEPQPNATRFSWI